MDNGQDGGRGSARFSLESLKWKGNREMGEGGGKSLRTSLGKAAASVRGAAASPRQPGDRVRGPKQPADSVRGLKWLGDSVKGPKQPGDSVRSPRQPGDSVRGLGASVRGPAASVRLKNALTLSEARKLAKEMDRRQSFDPRASTKAIIAGLRSLLHPLDIEDREPDEMDDAELESFFNPGQEHFKEASAALAMHISAHKPWYLINPEGLFRRIWDSAATIMIYAVVLYVPVMMAYFDQDCCTYIVSNQANCNPRGVPGAPCDPGFQVFPVIANYFFVMDIILNFMTGFVTSDGGAHYELLSIWSHYCRSWFALDVITCIPFDCILIAAANQVPWYNSWQYVRLLRAFGIRRRARGSPFRWVDRISDIRQEFSYSARRIVHVAFITFVGLHYFACLLWFIVRLQNFPSVSWPVQLGVVDASVAEQYLWSLFNVISGMIGLGYGAFPPRTWPEALVWCFAMVTLASLFAVMNGFIISAILSSASSRQKYKERMDLILTATRSRDLPEDLRKRIITFLRYKYAHRPLQDETTVWNELPPDMQAQVALASTSKLLDKVPLLAADNMLLERVALLLKPAYAIAGEDIIRQGWPVTTMFFIQNGFVDLTLDTHVADTLSEGHFFGEAAMLLTPTDEECRELLHCEPAEISNFTDAYTAVVTATALTNCEMFALAAADFHAMVHDYPSALQEIQAISLRYAERIKKRDGANLFMRSSHRHSPGTRHHGPVGETGHHRVSAATYQRMLSGGRASLDGDVPRPRGGLGLPTLSMPEPESYHAPQLMRRGSQ